MSSVPWLPGTSLKWARSPAKRPLKPYTPIWATRHWGLGQNVEIGGGRITGTEVTSEHPEGIAFGMYHADQYVAPEGQYTTVHAADGTAWYKQYAVDAVDKTPYMAPDGSIAYNESIVKKLPPTPKRKDKI